MLTNVGPGALGLESRQTPRRGTWGTGWRGARWCSSRSRGYILAPWPTNSFPSSSTRIARLCRALACPSKAGMPAPMLSATLATNVPNCRFFK
eukprot:7901915-Pyramimonas_sp.AAC.1